MSESRNKLFEELNREIEYYSPHTQSQYRSHLNDYLVFVGPNRDWRDRDILYNYTKKLKKKGLSQNSVNYVIRGPIGALFRAYGLRIPVKLPRVQPAVYSPEKELFFATEEIEAMVKVVRAGTAHPLRAIMAIATVYGPRASELVRVQKENILPKKNVIIIYTVKYNLKRQHLIPAEIKPVLFSSQYSSISPAVLYTMFNEVCSKAGVERKFRQSFHAIRHTIIDELSYCGFTDEQIYDFTGWRKPGTLGSYVRPLTFKPKNDEAIFEKHPFLSFWE